MVSPGAALPELRQLLNRYFAECEGQRLLHCSLVERHVRPYSEVLQFRVQLTGGVRWVYGKRTLVHPDNAAIADCRHQALVEYEVLSQLYHHFAQFPGCNIPRPLIVDRTANIYFMEKVEGHPLADDLSSLRRCTSGSRLARLCAAYQGCGRWLKIFQTVTASPSVSASAAMSGVLQRCRTRLEWIGEREGSLIPAGLAEQTGAFLDEQLGELAEDGVAVCGQHGDFGPWNVFVNEREVTVLDFFGYDQGPPALDLLTMLMHLAKESQAVGSSRRRVEQVRDSFLSGYGPLPATPLAVVRLCEAQRHIYTLWGILSRPKSSWLRRCQEQRCFADAVQWLNGAWRHTTTWPNLQKELLYT